MTIQERVKVIDVLALVAVAPLVVDHEASVATVIDEMREGDTGCALVVRQDKLAGIFTERDVLNKVLGDTGALARPVSAFMTADPACVTEHDSIREAAAQVHRGGFRNVPVVDDDGAPVACIRHKDVIAYLVESFADRTLNLPPDPDQIATKPEGA